MLAGRRIIHEAQKKGQIQGETGNGSRIRVGGAAEQEPKAVANAESAEREADDEASDWEEEHEEDAPDSDKDDSDEDGSATSGSNS